MLYEDVDFKTLSDRYTNSRMVPFLTHIERVKANLFSIPYNGIFSRRQIFAVLSKKKHGDYLLRILIFAVANVREI